MAKKATKATKATKAKKAPAKATTKSKAAPKKAAKGGADSGFMKALDLSPELQKVVGKVKAARTEVTKGLWAYIKKHNLQDPKSKRDIITDANLKAVFGKARVNMFEMTKLIGKHLK